MCQALLKTLHSFTHLVLLIPRWIRNYYNYHLTNEETEPLIKQLAPKYRTAGPRNWSPFHLTFKPSHSQEYCPNRNAQSQFQDLYIQLTTNSSFPSSPLLIFWFHQDTQVRDPTTFSPSLFPVPTHVLTLLTIRYLHSLAVIVSSLERSSLHDIHWKKHPPTLCLLHAKTWEADHDWRLKLYNHRCAHFKVIISNPREPLVPLRILQYFILSPAWITPSHFLLPLSRSQLMILLISLRKLKPWGENMYAFSQHLPTCLYLCWCPVFSLSFHCGWMATLHLSPSLPIYSGTWFQQFSALFPASSKFPFP